MVRPRLTWSVVVGLVAATLTFSYVLTGLFGVGRDGVGSGALVLTLLTGVAFRGVAWPGFTLFDGAVVAFVFLSLVHGVFRVDASTSIAQSVQLTVSGGLPYFLLRFSPAPEELFEWFLKGLLLLGFSCAGYIVVWGLGGSGVFGVRVGNEILNPNALGLLFGSAALAGLSVLRHPGSWVWRFGGLVGAALCLSVLLVTASRAALGGTLVGATLLLLARTSANYRVLAVASLGTLVGLSVWLAPRFFPESAFVIRVVSLQDLGSVYERQALYATAMDHIVRRPFLGLGLGRFQDLHGNYVHNLLLDLLVTFGVTGLLIYLVFLLEVTRTSLSAFRKRASPWLPAAASLLLFAFLVRQTSLTLGASKDFLIFSALALGLRGRAADKVRSSE